MGDPDMPAHTPVASTRGDDDVATGPDEPWSDAEDLDVEGLGVRPLRDRPPLPDHARADVVQRHDRIAKVGRYRERRGRPEQDHSGCESESAPQQTS
jgi:hypothetical protein